MIVKTTENTYRREFHSWNEFVDYCDDKVQPQPGGNVRTSRYDMFGFSQVNTFAEAVNLARTGWKEGVALYEEYARGIKQVQDTTNEYEYDVFGDIIEMGEFVTGNPLCMIKLERKFNDHFGEVMLVVVNIGAVLFADSESFYRRGVTLVKLLKHIEQNGISTALVGVWTTKRANPSSKASKEYDHYYTVSMPIKTPGKLIDVDRIMFATAHPAMLRRLCFSAAESEPKKIVDKFGFHANGPYGHSCEILTDCHIYVPSPQNHFFNDNIASKWLNETVMSLKI